MCVWCSGLMLVEYPNGGLLWTYGGDVLVGDESEWTSVSYCCAYLEEEEEELVRVIIVG